jgi:hypothetical protein
MANATPRPLYPLCRRWGALQSWSGEVGKILPPPVFNPLTVQPVTSRYADTLTRLLSVIIYSGITNKTQRYTMVFITTNALHVSGGSCAHHQESKTVYLTVAIPMCLKIGYKEFISQKHLVYFSC